MSITEQQVKEWVLENNPTMGEWASIRDSADIFHCTDVKRDWTKAMSGCLGVRIEVNESGTSYSVMLTPADAIAFGKSVIAKAGRCDA